MTLSIGIPLLGDARLFAGNVHAMCSSASRPPCDKCKALLLSLARSVRCVQSALLCANVSVLTRSAGLLISSLSVVGRRMNSDCGTTLNVLFKTSLQLGLSVQIALYNDITCFYMIFLRAASAPDLYLLLAVPSLLGLVDGLK